MKRVMPDTLAMRMLFVLGTGLIASHILSIAIHFGDRTSESAGLGSEHIAEHVSTIVRVVEVTPLRDRSTIVGAMDGASLALSVSKTALVDVGSNEEPRARKMRATLQTYLNGTERAQTNVRYEEVTSEALRRLKNIGTGAKRSGRTFSAFEGASFLISISLPDSAWLNLVAPVPVQQSFLNLRLFLSIAVMAAAVLAAAIWAVHRITDPLSEFAHAAQRLGADVTAEPLTESGPREIRQAAHAFNEMQKRIRRFVDDRTQLIAAISHDLRTPITRLKLRAEFVEDEVQQRKMMTDLDDMESMIASVLSFAKDDANVEESTRFDLASVLQSVCHDSGDLGNEVEYEGISRLDYTGRYLALKRAFANLVENAVKFGDRAHVQATISSGNVVISIDDEGPGIPEDERDKVFEPFYRVESSRSRETGGVGLGLAFSRGIIRAHGGDITLQNRSEGGLRVEVKLPMAQD